MVVKGAKRSDEVGGAVWARQVLSRTNGRDSYLAYQTFIETLPNSGDVPAVVEIEVVLLESIKQDGL